ncbi:MAG: pyridoxal-phosphate dependent enzyme, partial [Flammeovirgaceae bacterium]
QELQEKLFLTSANSINIARLIPQSFYYFYAWSRMETEKPVVFSVPSGNFGNLTAGLLAKRMGLPVHHFVASTNINDIVPAYLASGLFEPRPSQSTISNAMDVGNPSNFARMLELYEHSHVAMKRDISGFYFSDEETKAAMQKVFQSDKYVMDPHGAVGYLGLKRYQQSNPDTAGIFLETAHPAKFKETVDATLPHGVEIPQSLLKFLSRKKSSIGIGNDFNDLKGWLID